MLWPICLTYIYGVNCGVMILDQTWQSLTRVKHDNSECCACLLQKCDCGSCDLPIVRVWLSDNLLSVCLFYPLMIMTFVLIFFVFCNSLKFSLMKRVQKPVAKPSPEKASKKPVSKTEEKKGKTVEVAKQEPLLDPVAEKLRQQRYFCHC